VKLTITIDDRKYELDVEVEADPTPPASSVIPQPMPTHVSVPSGPPAPSATPSRDPADEARVCRSPIAGVVVRVTAQTGQQLQENDLLMVLEAMKMETNITAPRAGVVQAVTVAPGDAVTVGQVLVELA
jgi:methylmalonyl-CoA carboxyltransferase 1.3S subunit